MMIFVPIGQEHEIRRWPAVTIILIAIMSVLQLYNEFTVRRAGERYVIIKARYDKLFSEYRAEYHRLYGPKADPGDWRKTVEDLREFSKTQDELQFKSLGRWVVNS